MLLHALIAIAFAQDPSPAPSPDGALVLDPDPALVHDPALSPLPTEVTPRSPDELVDEAWRRIDLRDYEGTRIVAEEAIARDPAVKLRATAAIAASYELDGDPDRGLAMYREVLAADPTGDLANHMHMRIAECLGALGRYDEALAELAILGDPAAWPYLDGKKIRLLRGTWWLEMGDREAGMAELGDALSGMAVDDVRYYQAEARAAIAHDLLDQAGALSFDDHQKRTVKHLQARTALILDAEKQVVEAINLKEPEWALQGLLDLGGAYEKVGDDLLGVPPPHKLKTQEQRELYASTLQKKVQVLYVKASRYDEQGLELAARLSWKSRRIASLEAALAEVQPKIRHETPPAAQ